MFKDMTSNRNGLAQNGGTSPYQVEISPLLLGNNMIYCATCGTIIAKSAKYCPRCGARNKLAKSFYERCWLFALCVVLAIAIVTAIVAKPSPIKEPIDRNGFSSETGTQINCGGISFILPDYYIAETGNSSDNSVFSAKEKRGEAYIICGEESSYATNAEFYDHEATFTEIVKEMGAELASSANCSVSVLPPTHSMVAGCSALAYSLQFIGTPSYTGQYQIINNPAHSAFIIMCFVQNGVDYDYSNDYQRILNNATRNYTGSADFRALMDSYEAFFDEYIAFMKKYTSNSGNTASMMNDYLNYLSKYTDMMEKMQSIDTSSLSNEDLAYYLEVTNRITQKLLAYAG